MSMEHLAYTTDPNPILDMLSQETKSERMEFALPLIESMRVSFALNKTMGDTPPGTLTVQGWMGLLSRWERILAEMPPRRIHFSIDFFREILDRKELGQSPIGAVLEQLLEMMASYQQEESRQAA